MIALLLLLMSLAVLAVGGTVILLWPVIKFKMRE